MARSAIVLGAGMVGVSVALHLRRRGYDVTLVDRQGPGEGASFGNGGLIQREAVYPHPFPRSLTEIGRVARNRSIDVSVRTIGEPHRRAIPKAISEPAVQPGVVGTIGRIGDEAGGRIASGAQVFGERRGLAAKRGQPSDIQLVGPPAGEEAGV